MQTSFDFYPQPADETKKVSSAPETPQTTKEKLEQYINVCGLVAYKDFFIKIKNGLTAIPEGVNKAQYLDIAREVYQGRAGRVSRAQGRSKFFAIQNRIKKAND